MRPPSCRAPARQGRGTSCTRRLSTARLLPAVVMLLARAFDTPSRRVRDPLLGERWARTAWRAGIGVEARAEAPARTSCNATGSSKGVKASAGGVFIAIEQASTATPMESECRSCSTHRALSKLSCSAFILIGARRAVATNGGEDDMSAGEPSTKPNVMGSIEKARIITMCRDERCGKTRTGQSRAFCGILRSENATGASYTSICSVCRAKV